MRTTIQPTPRPAPTNPRVYRSARTFDERGALDWLGPRLRLLGRIAAGGMGAVYRAHDEERGELVAVKTFRVESPESLLRLKAEFRIGRALRHPGIVRVHELFTSDLQAAFTMELVEGVSPGEWVRDALPRGARRPSAGSRLPATMDAPASPVGGARSRRAVRGGSGGDAVAEVERRVRTVVIGLLETLAWMHGRGEVHRDVKPANVLVAADGRVVLLDLGLARRLTERDPLDPDSAGTPAYLAPEVRDGAPPDPRSDMYALGVVLGELLDGAAGVLTSPALEQLADALVGPPEARPSAAEALRALGAPLPAPPVEALVGRARELGFLEVALFDPARPPVLVRGSSGIGKSALLRGVVDRLQARAVVIEGRCSPHEDVPGGVLDSLVDGAVRALARVGGGMDGLAPARQAVLARAYPVVAAVLDVAAELPEVREDELPGALGAFLAGVNAGGPVVLAIDDLHWASEGDLALLLQLAEAHPALRLLLAARPGERCDTLLGRPGVRLLELEGLTPADAARLATSLGAPSPAGMPETAPVSPLLVHELLSGASGDVHRDADALLAERVAAEPADTRALVRYTCLAHVPLRPHELRGLTGFTGAVRAELDRLVSRRLLREESDAGTIAYAPFHDRVRATIARDAQPSEHIRLVEILARRPGIEPAVLANHWLAAGRADAAFPLLLDAVDRAEARFLHGAAVWALRAAVSFAPERTDLRARLAAALSRDGRALEAADEWLACAGATEGPERLAMQGRAAELLLGAGRFAEGNDVLDRVLAEAGVRTPRSALGRLVDGAVWAIRAATRRLDPPPKGATEAPDASVRTRLWACWTAANCRGYFDPIGAMGARARHFVWAWNAGDPENVTSAVSLEAVYVGSTGSRSGRVQALDRTLEAWLARVSSVEVRGQVRVAQAFRHYTAFAFHRAIADYTEGLAQLAPTGASRWESLLSRAHLASAHAHFGAYAYAFEDARKLAWTAENTGNVALAFLVAHLVGYAERLAADDPDGADALLRRTRERWPGPLPASYSVMELVGRVRVDAYRGRPSLAPFERPRPEWMFMGRFPLARLSVRAAWLLALVGAGRTATLRYRRLAWLLRREPLPWPRAVERVGAAVIARRRGREEPAHAALAEALRLYEEAEMRPQALGVRWHLAEGQARAEVEAELRALGIQNPARWAGMEVPP